MPAPATDAAAVAVGSRWACRGGKHGGLPVTVVRVNAASVKLAVDKRGARAGRLSGGERDWHMGLDAFLARYTLVSTPPAAPAPAPVLPAEPEEAPMAAAAPEEAPAEGVTPPRKQYRVVMLRVVEDVVLGKDVLDALSEAQALDPQAEITAIELVR